MSAAKNTPINPDIFMCFTKPNSWNIEVIPWSVDPGEI
jgi:hypothetical protein